MICKRCGALNKEGVFWCEKCGLPLTIQNVNAQQDGVQPSVTPNNVGGVQPSLNDNIKSDNISQSQDDYASMVRVAIKMDAKKRKKGTIIAALLFTFIISIFSSIGISILPFILTANSVMPVGRLYVALYVVVFLVISILNIQVMMKVSLEVSRGNHVTLGSAFKYVFMHIGNAFKVLGIYFIFVILTILFMFFVIQALGILITLIMMIIIAIYFGTALSLCNLIAVDDLNHGKMQGGMFSRCMKLMSGHRVEYICLIFSFIGWILLIPFTLGLLSLWVIPYMSISFASFYRHLNKEVEYKM